LYARSTFDDHFTLYRCPEETPKCALKEGFEVIIDRNKLVFPADVDKHIAYGNIDVQNELKNNPEFARYLY
jgi:hypothetical protein